MAFTEMLSQIRGRITRRLRTVELATSIPDDPPDPVKLEAFPDTAEGWLARMNKNPEDHPLGPVVHMVFKHNGEANVDHIIQRVSEKFEIAPEDVVIPHIPGMIEINQETNIVTLPPIRGSQDNTTSSPATRTSQ